MSKRLPAAGHVPDAIVTWTTGEFADAGDTVVHPLAPALADHDRSAYATFDTPIDWA